jgi:hypothetical protein
MKNRAGQLWKDGGERAFLVVGRPKAPEAPGQLWAYHPVVWLRSGEPDYAYEPGGESFEEDRTMQRVE